MIGLFGSQLAVPAVAQGTFIDAVTSGRITLDARLRFEDADQENKPKNGVATTIRARLGYQTGVFQGFSALAEIDAITHIGAKHFNDSINGLTAYPTIPDPDMLVLNRLQLSYTARLTADADAPPDFHINLGRQRIIFGDARFIGNAPWRQHEQTFDAVLLSESLSGLTLSYAYVDRVNRVFGPDSPVGTYDSNSHLFNAVYDGLGPVLKLEAYAYLLDLHQAPNLSSATYGFRGESVIPLGPALTGRLNAAFAHQSDYANNPLDICSPII